MPRKKASNGSGSVYRRPNGHYVAALVVGVTADGRQQRRTHSARTAREAREWLADAQVALRKGFLAPAVHGTFAELVEAWLRASALETRGSSQLTYRTQMARHALPRLGDVPLGRLSRQDLQDVLADMVDQGYAAGTVHYTRALLHAACAYAVDTGLLPTNLAQHLKCPKVEPADKRILSQAECWQLLDGVRGTTYEAVPVLALTTGLRLGELLGLQWADVDWQAGTLAVCRTVARGAAGLTVNPTKTRAGKRPLLLTDIGLAALKRQRARDAELRLAAGPAWTENDWVFPNHVGRLYWCENYRREVWRPLVARIGLPDLRPHACRHSLATILAALGVPPATAQRILGHSRVTTTLDVYVHPGAEEQREAMGKLGAWLGR